MIIFAIIIFAIFSLLPKWILKGKYKQLENTFNWKIPLIKLVGLSLTLIIVFLLILGYTKSTKETFIENDNAIYGLKFSSAFKDLGFQDSSRIKTINGSKTNRVSDIARDIILADAPVEILVEKDKKIDTIKLRREDQIKLIKHSTLKDITPIMYDSNGENMITISTKDLGFYDALNTFGDIWKQSTLVFNFKLSSNDKVGGFVSIAKIKNIKGFLIILSLNLLIVLMINLLPIPGFSIGNFIISIIETFRKKLFNKKMLKTIQSISIALIIIILILTIII